MKKFVCGLLAVLMCLALVGCGTLSKEKAIDLALDELGLSRITTARVDAQLDESTDPATYKVIVYQAYTNQIVILDAKSGEVLSTSVEDANRN